MGIRKNVKTRNSPSLRASYGIATDAETDARYRSHGRRAYLPSVAVAITDATRSAARRIDDGAAAWDLPAGSLCVESWRREGQPWCRVGPVVAAVVPVGHHQNPDPDGTLQRLVVGGPCCQHATEGLGG